MEEAGLTVTAATNREGQWRAESSGATAPVVDDRVGVVGRVRRLEGRSRVASGKLGDGGDERNKLVRSSVPVALWRECGSTGDSL